MRAYVFWGLGACVVALATGCTSTEDGAAPAEGSASSITSSPDRDRLDVSALPAAVVTTATDLQTHGPARRGATARTTVAHGIPIYEPDDSNRPALYEIDLAPGWAVVRANGEALELGTSGQGPVATLLASSASAAPQRAVRLDTALYVALDENGKSVAQTTHGISRIDREGAEATLVATTAEEAIQDWSSVRRELDRRVAARGGSAGGLIRAADPRTCVAPGDVPKFTQISPNSAPNNTGCHSGCGPTAWAMIFGWASKRAAVSSADSAFRGLFRTGNDALGVAVVAPTQMNADARELTWTLREKIGTFCLSDQGATTPGSMKKASAFAASRAPGVTVDVDYDSWFITDDGIKDGVIDALCAGRPSIIGIGGLFSADMHYPIAKAYEDTWLWLEMGWGGSGDAWYQTGTWFKGNVHH